VIWQVIAQASAGLGKNDLAAAAYTASITAYNQDASAYINAADFYVKIGNKDKARQMIADGKKALPSNTQFDTASKTLGL
jgi:tetratricopeptide (TPR) repeat protein